MFCYPHPVPRQAEQCVDGSESGVVVPVAASGIIQIPRRQYHAEYHGMWSIAGSTDSTIARTSAWRVFGRGLLLIGDVVEFRFCRFQVTSGSGKASRRTRADLRHRADVENPLRAHLVPLAEPRRQAPALTSDTQSEKPNNEQSHTDRPEDGRPHAVIAQVQSRVIPGRSARAQHPPWSPIP